ncbi:MAG: toll/interleukin-1 receptor domain-containing protein [Halobacteriota archaeon]|nr:toll/interleukin-1 receptor domain-containing protein [Halobacteriota archaeon]
MNYTFISHSSADEELAEQLAKRFKKEDVWFDKWNLDVGDLIPQGLAEAIHESKWFILIASREAMESRWVRYELNIAITNSIQDSDYRIIVARIDECEVHPELTPFLYVDYPGQPDLALYKITELIKTEGSGVIPQNRDRRRQFVNRFKEIAGIEDTSNEGIKFIFLWGLYGIGKTVLGERVGIIATMDKVSTDAKRFFEEETHRREYPVKIQYLEGSENIRKDITKIVEDVTLSQVHRMIRPFSARIGFDLWSIVEYWIGIKQNDTFENEIAATPDNSG